MFLLCHLLRCLLQVMDCCQVVTSMFFLHFVCTYSIITSVRILILNHGFFQCLTGISGFINRRRISFYLYTCIDQCKVRLCMRLLALYDIINPSLFFFAGKGCVGHSFAYVAHFVFCIFERCLESTRAQRAAVASRCAPNLASSHPSPLTVFL